MKAYWCTPKDWDECSDVVFAETRGKAISIAIHRGESCNECEFTEVRAVRCPKADKYSDNPSQLYSNKVWREIGGCADISEDRCDTCGLAIMEGDFPLCETCGNCEDCVGKLVLDHDDWVCSECFEVERKGERK